MTKEQQKEFVTSGSVSISKKLDEWGDIPIGVEEGQLLRIKDIKDSKLRLHLCDTKAASEPLEGGQIIAFLKYAKEVYEIESSFGNNAQSRTHQVCRLEFLHEDKIKRTVLHPNYFWEAFEKVDNELCAKD